MYLTGEGNRKTFPATNSDNGFFANCGTIVVIIQRLDFCYFPITQNYSKIESHVRGNFQRDFFTVKRITVCD